MAALDAAEITQRVRELAARHEQLHERLSRQIGPVDGYETMTSPELAAYGLEKLSAGVPSDDEHPAVAKLEGLLHGRASSGTGAAGIAGMDSAGDSFVDRYIASS
jgi:hypothetical protein